MDERIVVISGGHGSTFLFEKIKCHKRPDVVFDPYNNPELTLGDTPLKEVCAEFKKRTNGFHTLDINKSIEQNFVEYLTRVNELGAHTIINGRISRIGPLFSNNPIDNVVCVVRHPLHAMVSLLVHRHPEKAKRFSGGFSSEEAVYYYAKLWNDTVKDQLNSDAKFIRFEYAVKDSEVLHNPLWKNLFKLWNTDIRNFGVLDGKLEALLKTLVSDAYNELYDVWYI